jgi:pre-60S factor REI1
MVHDTSGALTAFPCNTCSLSFKNSLLQRSHMQSAWHINNLQRKISGQPALSEAEFGECMEKNTAGRRKKSRHDDNSVDDSQRDMEIDISGGSDGHASETSDSSIHNMEQSGHSSKQTDTSLSSIQDSTRCLFCALISPNTDDNISHMSSAHSFFLPVDSISTAAVEPLLSYLSLLIYTYHECIYCGREKNSIHGVQSHMRDSAHCKLDVSLYEEFFSSGEDEDTQEEEDNTTGTESDEREADDESTQEKTRHNISSSTDGAKKKPLLRKTRKEKIQHPKPHPQHARSRTSLSEQQAADITSLQTTTSQNSSLTHSYPSSHLPPLPLPPAPQNGRNSALSLAGLSNTQLVSLATLDKKMRRQQVSAQKRVNQLALRQPVKAIYYKTENPVYQAG